MTIEKPIMSIFELPHQFHIRGMKKLYIRASYITDPSPRGKNDGML